MGSGVFHIPSNMKREALAKMLRWHWERGNGELSQKRIAWTVSHCWLQGLRPLRNNKGVVTYGLPSQAIADVKGRKRIRVENTLVRGVAEIGRILSIDTRLAVERQGGLGLDTLRSESMAQAAFDAAETATEDPQRNVNQAYALMAYGMTGVGVFSRLRGDKWLPNIGLIPPWELRPLPPACYSPEESCGFSWTRWVPLAWLRKYFAGQIKLPSDIAKLRPRNALLGTKIIDEQAPWSLAGYGGAMGAGAGGSTSGSKDMDQVGNPLKKNPTKGTPDETGQFVQLVENYIVGPDGHLDHYIPMVGPEWIAGWANFVEGEHAEMAEDDPAFPSINFARYNTVGSWYPRSFSERLTPLDNAFEELYSESVKNLAEIDRMRAVWFPHGMGVNQRNLKMDHRNRYGFFAPDLSQNPSKPFVVDPANAGDGSLRMLAMTAQTIDAASGQSGLMFGDTKRVDSAGGLAMLQDASGTTLAMCGESLDSCYRGVGRSILSYMRSRLNPDLFPTMPGNVGIRLSRMDETVLGVVVNPETGLVELSKYSLPRPDMLRLKIRNKLPMDKNGLIQDIRERVGAGLLSPVEADILYVVHGLEVPSLRRQYYSQYQLAWLENLILFGDGQTPGEILGEDSGDNHAIHWMVHMEVVSTAILRYGAALPVRAKMVNHALRHKGWTGWPQGLAIPSQFKGPAPIPQGAADAAGLPPAGFDAAA